MTDADDEGAQERRQGPRGSALWQARVRTGADSYRCRVYDFSLTGAKIWIDESLEPGTAVKLDIDQIGVIRGRVAWTDAVRMGIEFTSDADEVRYLLGPRGRRMGIE
jgi:hypothetical protein